jgi:superfamily I DNA/RNA helicase
VLSVVKYIKKVIQNVSSDDINESWAEANPYYTVLITGQTQYLNKINIELLKEYPQLKYKHSEQSKITVTDGYDLLLKDITSNLGWRILADFYLRKRERIAIIHKSEKGQRMIDAIPRNFKQDQEKVVNMTRSLKQKQTIDNAELKKYTSNFFDCIYQYYSPKEKRKEEIDKTKPSILLTSFVGCKGLSAGHVIMVGINNTSIPENPDHISDNEISKFLVAMTRTRKQCHILSNKWLYAPTGKTAQQRSLFLSWIPSELTQNHGYLLAHDIDNITF